MIGPAGFDVMAGDSCYFCGSEKEIETHHVLPQRFRGGDGRSNMVDLCHDCHWKLERLYNKDFWQRLGIEDPRTTAKTHLVCEYDQCQEAAVAKYTIAGQTGDSVAWYCSDHADEMDSRDSWTHSKSVDLRLDEVDLDGDGTDSEDDDLKTQVFEAIMALITPYRSSVPKTAIFNHEEIDASEDEIIDAIESLEYHNLIKKPRGGGYALGPEGRKRQMKRKGWR